MILAGTGLISGLVLVTGLSCYSSLMLYWWLLRRRPPRGSEMEMCPLPELPGTTSMESFFSDDSQTDAESSDFTEDY